MAWHVGEHGGKDDHEEAHSGEGGEEEGTAAELVNEEEAEDGEDEVEDADKDVHADGLGGAGTGVLGEDDGAVVEDGVETGDLLDDGQHDGEGEGLAEGEAEEFAVGSGLLADGFADFIDGGFDVGAGGDALEDGEGLLAFAVLEEPAGAFRNGEHGDAEGDGGDGTEGEHQAPVAVDVLREFVVDHEADEGSADEGELVESDEHAALVGGGDFGDIKGADEQGRAEGHAGECAGDHELGDLVGGGGAEGSDAEEEPGAEEDGAAAIAVTGPSADGGAEGASDKEDGGERLSGDGAEVEVGAEEDEGAVDDGHVVAEEQTGGGGGGGCDDDIKGGFFRLLHDGPLSGIAGRRAGTGDGIPAGGRGGRLEFA